MLSVLAQLTGKLKHKLCSHSDFFSHISYQSLLIYNKDGDSLMFRYVSLSCVILLLKMKHEKKHL